MLLSLEQLSYLMAKANMLKQTKAVDAVAKDGDLNQQVRVSFIRLKP